MLRDFTKSNKDYFNKNKFILIGVAIFLIIGIVLWSVFGLNGNFEIKGYTEFSIKAGENKANYSAICETAQEVVNSYGGNYDNYQIFNEGDNTEIVIRYTNALTSENQAKINADIASNLELDDYQISEHISVKPVVDKIDYLYTAAAILIIAVVAILFAYFRYNGASALSLMIAYIMGTLGYISISAILRLSIGASFLAMLVILNTVITYFAFNLFESIRNSSWLGNGDYATALKSAFKETKLRTSLLSIAILLLGVLFVVVAPVTLKYVSLNIMFMAVVVLATAWYVIPFVWSALITSSRKKVYRVKATKEESDK